MAQGNTNGLMDESMRALGKIIRCTVRAHSLFQTAGIIKVLIETTRRMEEVFTFGLMGEGMKENFTKENSMELELLSLKMENKE